MLHYCRSLHETRGVIRRVQPSITLACWTKVYLPTREPQTHTQSERVNEWDSGRLTDDSWSCVHACKLCPTSPTQSLENWPRGWKYTPLHGQTSFHVWRDSRGRGEMEEMTPLAFASNREAKLRPHYVEVGSCGPLLTLSHQSTTQTSFIFHSLTHFISFQTLKNLL
jgi:hypothetical protein